MNKPSKSLVGRRIRCVKCDVRIVIDAPLTGDVGTVTQVDDDGTVQVKWDKGGVYGLLWDEGDRWTVLPAST